MLEKTIKQELVFQPTKTTEAQRYTITLPDVVADLT